MKKQEEDFEKEMNELAKAPKGDITVAEGLDIHGMEEVPTSIIPIPYVRLVQPTSQKIEGADGKDAAAGTFFFNDSLRTVEELKVAIIKGKHAKVQYDPEQPPVIRVGILAKELETGKIFILSLSYSSFSNFGRLIAQLKEKNTKNVWEYEVSITSEKQENDKGKFYVAKFKVGEKLSKEEQEEIEILHDKYGAVLEARQKQESEEF